MITVLGAGGFIGAHLAAFLDRSGLPFQAFGREGPPPGRPLGHVVDCVGVTGDFRARPLDAVAAHVGRLPALLDAADFESFLYLSSVRAYRGGAGPAREETPLSLDPADPDALYDLSKAAGEALVLSLGPKGRIARLANVYGIGQRDTFLAAIIAEGKASGSLCLRSALDSEKDYVSVEDVVELLVKIALGGRRRTYNVASGIRISHGRLVAALAQATGWRIAVAADAPSVPFPPIDVSRIREEFGFAPRNLFDALPALVAAA
ncbi:MAG TPA: NAD-dependent epimerase/dehydratase family protein [Allosphingosinicella sp.]|nr:NAD-dependent epimerase/dehydratase family protein [Allosphingosinicella sp.]